MRNLFNFGGAFLLAVTLGLTGCATPLTDFNSSPTSPAFGIASQMVDQDKKVLTYTIPIR